jgi:hypothetical protein
MTLVSIFERKTIHSKEDQYKWWNIYMTLGRAIAEAVSFWLPTAAARVWTQVKPCGICGGQSSTGAGFLQVLLFPLPILIPPTAPHSSSIIRGWYSSPIRGRRAKWTQSHNIHETKQENTLHISAFLGHFQRLTCKRNLLPNFCRC